MFANHGKKDGIYPLTIIIIEIAMHKTKIKFKIYCHKRKITRSILKTCKNIKSGFAFSTY